MQMKKTKGKKGKRQKARFRSPVFLTTGTLSGQRSPWVYAVSVKRMRRCVCSDEERVSVCEGWYARLMREWNKCVGVG